VNKTTLNAAIAEAQRFLERATELQKTGLILCGSPKTAAVRQILCGSPKTAAVRRASMDLTRALATLRKPD
jgi:hypothetical protein